MKRNIIISAVLAALTMAGTAFAGDRGIDMSVNPEPALLGSSARYLCEGTGDWENGLKTADITIYNSYGSILVDRAAMNRDGDLASYDYTVPAGQNAGMFEFRCELEDYDNHDETDRLDYQVSASGTGGGSGGQSGVAAHASITSYDGPSTCVACHLDDANEMLNSLHMVWEGPTPDMTNGGGASLGKQVKGINTFCTYAPTSGGACYSCHVSYTGNSGNAPTVNDVDCLMCHNDTYQRMNVSDPNNSRTVTNILGETRTYYFGKREANGDYVMAPNFAKMPAGTTMVEIAQNVHMPTRKSCLRCHAKAGGGDWTKRGDLGLNSVAPTVAQDVHMSPDAGGADLSCTACHATNGHKIGGRGIDLRQTEAPNPECQDCHGATPHLSSVLNRHATEQVACQVCHISEFGKGGATEMSRDWMQPHWNPAFCAGQGGFVGHEVKVANVKPEYVWFDGTSYVYNVGETITAGADGVYHMAKANGEIFDGKSKIVPIKRHDTVMPLHESGVIVPPVIMEMFMSGTFDDAVQAGMVDQGLTGNYTMIDADAEMLITHGVEPKSMAPSCSDCHDYTGQTTGGRIPFAELGYHTWPAKVKNCTLCHESESMSWQNMHDKHAEELGKDCANCHTTEPTGWIEPPTENGLCNNCHSGESENDAQRIHKKHVDESHNGQAITCRSCHTF